MPKDDFVFGHSFMAKFCVLYARRRRADRKQRRQRRQRGKGGKESCCRIFRDRKEKRTFSQIEASAFSYSFLPQSSRKYFRPRQGIGKKKTIYPHEYWKLLGTYLRWREPPTYLQTSHPDSLF